MAGPKEFPSAAVAAVSDIIREVDYPSYSPDAEIAGRVLRAASPHLSAQAWDEGFSAACAQHDMQRANPSHPITRPNPHEDDSKSVVEVHDVDLPHISAAVAAEVSAKDLVYIDNHGETVVMIPAIVQSVLDVLSARK